MEQRSRLEILLLTCAILMVADTRPQQQQKQQDKQEQLQQQEQQLMPKYAPAHTNYIPRDYAYEYGVTDPHTGDQKHHWEVNKGGVVVGAYNLTDPDGAIRTVEYRADKLGFRANIKTVNKGVQTQQEHGVPPSPAVNHQQPVKYHQPIKSDPPRLLEEKQELIEERNGNEAERKDDVEEEKTAEKEEEKEEYEDEEDSPPRQKHESYEDEDEEEVDNRPQHLEEDQNENYEEDEEEEERPRYRTQVSDDDDDEETHSEQNVDEDEEEEEQPRHSRLSDQDDDEDEEEEEEEESRIAKVTEKSEQAETKKQLEEPTKERVNYADEHLKFIAPQLLSVEKNDPLPSFTSFVDQNFLSKREAVLNSSTTNVTDQLGDSKV